MAQPTTSKQDAADAEIVNDPAAGTDYTSQESDASAEGDAVAPTPLKSNAKSVAVRSPTVHHDGDDAKHTDSEHEDDTPTRPPPTSTNGSEPIQLDSLYDDPIKPNSSATEKSALTGGVSKVVNGASPHVLTMKELILNIVMGVAIAVVFTFLMDRVGPFLTSLQPSAPGVPTPQDVARSFFQPRQKPATEMVPDVPVATASTTRGIFSINTSNDDNDNSADAKDSLNNKNSKDTSIMVDDEQQSPMSMLRGPGKMALMVVYFGAAHVVITGFAGYFTGLGFLLGNTLPPPPVAPKTLLQKAWRWIKRVAPKV